MTIKIRIPTPLQQFTRQARELNATGDTVIAVLNDLERQCPGVTIQILDEKRMDVRRFVNIFVNQEDIRFLKGLQTAVHEGDEISIIPAIAGGSFGIKGRAGC